MSRDDSGVFESEGFSDFGSEMGSERSIITARGTGDGLIIRLDGRADKESLREAFNDFIDSRKRFLAGNDVTLEWVGTIPEPSFVEELSHSAKDFDIKVKSSSLREGRGGSSFKDDLEIEIDVPVSRGGSAGLRQSDSSKVSAVRPGRKARSNEGLSLFGGIDQFPLEDEVKRTSRVTEHRPLAGGDLWDDADARIMFSTMRSGQKIESEHSIVIFGDVNSGAEIISGGDIVVLGTLRGVAHAGAYDETGGGRVIFALNLQPTQLRIGAVISRGSNSDGNRGSEIARVDGTAIIVEPYLAKGVLTRRRDQ